MTTSTTEGLPADVLADLAEFELIKEGAADQMLARRLLAADDVGWGRLDQDDREVITREQLLTQSHLARFMRIADPLICRGVNLAIAYVHGQGVTIAADQEEDAEQDVNAVVQAFLDDESNVATFTGQQAREELEARLKTDGNAFHCLPTSPLSGRVQVRTIPFREVVDVLTDPEDDATPWFYKRVYTTRVIEAGYAPGSTRTRRETRTIYYPALGYYPSTRVKSIDGKPVEWDKPVVHTAVNRPDGSLWGVPDLLAALPWARGYKEFLEDWAKLVKALSRLAFKTSAKSAAQAGQVRAALRPGEAGATVALGEGQQLEAIGKSGATIDSQSGRPLAAMVAAAIGVPVTMLLGDPGVTGARATAETLDQPMQLGNQARQTLHTHLIKRILGHVIDQAILAPAGPLKGSQVRDEFTGRLTVALANEQPRSVTVDWPSIEKVSIDVLVSAITKADDTGKLPPLVVARLLLVALDVDDVDEVLKELVDPATGEFVYPEDKAAAASALGAVNRGDVPGTPAPAAPAPPAAPVPPTPAPAAPAAPAA